MGTTYAPAYANKFNKFMVNFEEKFIYPWTEATASLYFVLLWHLYCMDKIRRRANQIFKWNKHQTHFN